MIMGLVLEIPPSIVRPTISRTRELVQATQGGRKGLGCGDPAPISQATSLALFHWNILCTQVSAKGIENAPSMVDNVTRPAT